MFFEKAMKISPRHTDRSFNFAKILLANNNVAKAKSLFTKVFELSEDETKVKEEVAFLYLKHKAFDESLHLLEELVIIYPERLDILINIARIYFAFKQPRTTIDFANKITKIEPNHFEANLLLAKSYILVKQVMRADEVLRKLMKLEPENEEVKKLFRENA
jgi:tetratricopeptide (TPR) repeat protein